MVGRARTGCGKTLAFVLPIVEQLMASAGQQRAYGRGPVCIVLAPTRELAKQVTTHLPRPSLPAMLLQCVSMTCSCTTPGAMRR
jgi:superfamily II DNA/RNA helicase